MTRRRKPKLPLRKRILRRYVQAWERDTPGGAFQEVWMVEEGDR